METFGVLGRLLAYMAGAALFGSPLFALYSGVAPARLRPLVGVAGAGVALAAATSLVSIAAQMAGDPRARLDPATLRDVIAGAGFGYSVILRMVAGLVGLALASVLAGAGCARLGAMGPPMKAWQAWSTWPPISPTCWRQGCGWAP